MCRLGRVAGGGGVLGVVVVCLYFSAVFSGGLARIMGVVGGGCMRVLFLLDTFPSLLMFAD